jgi:hypothetical protein
VKKEALDGVCLSSVCTLRSSVCAALLLFSVQCACLSACSKLSSGYGRLDKATSQHRARTSRGPSGPCSPS